MIVSKAVVKAQQAERRRQAIVEILKAAPRPMTASEVAVRAGLNVPTTSTLLGQLKVGNMVVRRRFYSQHVVHVGYKVYQQFTVCWTTLERKKELLKHAIPNGRRGRPRPRTDDMREMLDTLMQHGGMEPVVFRNGKYVPASTQLARARS